METYNALEKSWISSFESSNKNRILTALHEVRNAGSVKILPVLLNLVNQTSESEISREIINLVGDLKSAEAVPILAKSLKENDFGDYQGEMVAACWQSGLDFSNYLSVFTELFIKGDYSTAIEAFTVIEGSVSNANEEEITACIHYLKETERMVTEEKLPLYRELQKVIEMFDHW